MRENDKLTHRAKDQVLGCMVGGAVGDALGYAVEFMSYDSIVKKYGEKGITRYQLDRHGVAEISDDTQMSLFTAAGILLGLLVRYVNGCTTFWCGCLTAYALWFVVNWFDAFVLDCLWFCHDKHFVIPKTEDMVKDYHDYWFHIKGGFIGMLLAIPAALVAGLITII